MTSRKKNIPPPLGPDGLEELELWIKNHADDIPPVVKDALSQYNLLVEALAGDSRQLRSLIIQLRLALGITPSSEKRKNSGDPIGGNAKPGDPKPKDPKEQLLLSISRYQGLGNWHKDLAKQHRRKVRELKDKLMKVEDIELTPKERAENAKVQAEHMARLRLGDGADPAFESPKQAFMQGGDVRVDEKFVQAVVDSRLLEGEEIVSRMTDERTRYSFNLTVSTVSVAVEKVVVKDAESSTRIISASTQDIGPPRMNVTYEFLSNMVIMVAEYAMPFNRLGSLLTIPGKRFTSAMLSRMFCYVAQRFAPIYLHNFRSLANSPLLSGDDTKSRVIEFTRFLKDLQSDPNIAAQPPWSHYATRHAAEETFKKGASSGLGVLTARELGFESDRRDGNGPKKSLQTTVIWGRSEADNPRSAIVFYRSHIGGFGDLLSICLSLRRPELKNIIIQSDLSSVNLVSDSEIAERFAIEYAGCTSHARRPFAIYENEDPDLCAYMLHLFKGLYICEKGLDLFGRNETNVRAVRGVDSRQMWEEIKELAELMTKKWSKATKLGDAAHYILRHYSKLTAYLENPAISVSNDFSERMLRMENLIEANSLFRNSFEGRFALDINRSILQTAIAARAPLQDYTNYVLRASPEDVAAHPEEFTALAYTKKFPAPYAESEDPGS